VNDHTCKHFNGMMNKACDAGVVYDTVTIDPKAPGSAYRKPCIQWDKWQRLDGSQCTPEQLAEYAKRGTCSKFELPSEEELKAHELAITAMLNRMGKVAPLIKRVKTEHKGESWQGIFECPCCGNNLWMSHAAYNGHV